MDNIPSLKSMAAKVSVYVPGVQLPYEVYNLLSKNNKFLYDAVRDPDADIYLVHNLLSNDAMVYDVNTLLLIEVLYGSGRDSEDINDTLKEVFNSCYKRINKATLKMKGAKHKAVW